MFVLNTNVLSAVMGSQPVPEVAAWMSAQPEAQLFTTSVCKAEILAGVAIMPEGRRRNGFSHLRRKCLPDAKVPALDAIDHQIRR